MLRAERIAKRRGLCEEALAEVKRKSGTSLSALLPEQQAVRFAATQVLRAVSPLPMLRRLVGYFLLHCGLALPMSAVAAVMELGPRALSSLKHTPPSELLTAMARRPAGKRRKLRPEHLGPLCRFLVEHPRCTLRAALLARYSLGVLREERATARPLFAVTPPMPAPSSCFAQPCAQ